MAAEKEPIIQGFEKDGFYILENAISTDLADNIVKDMNDFNQKDGYIGILKRTPFSASHEHTEIEKFKFKDLHINNSNVRSAIFSDEITKIINKLLLGPYLAFQSLGFIKSTGLRIHRDSNYVSINDENPKVIACWLALEDITEESGPIKYYPRSHLLEKYVFSDGNDHWKKSIHGIFANEECHRWNQEQMKMHGIAGVPFLAKKGDCIFWDFNLSHEAMLPISNKSRYSMATHFCPISQTPMYLTNNKKTKIIQYSENAFFSSNHYPLKILNSCRELNGVTITPGCT